MNYRAYDEKYDVIFLVGFNVIGEATCFNAVEMYIDERKEDGETTLERLGDITLTPCIELKDIDGTDYYVYDVFKDERGKFHKIIPVPGGFGFTIHDDDFNKRPDKIMFYEGCSDPQNASFMRGCKITGHCFDQVKKHNAEFYQEAINKKM